MSPSAFIPFCDFGGDMSAMGQKIDQFEVPVCNSFQAKNFNDQLCYEVDLNKFTNKNNIVRELKLGFNFLMDYNEDRQVSLNRNIRKKELGLTSSLVESDMSHNAFVYLDTIGKGFNKNIFQLHCNLNNLEPVELIGEGEYNLNSLTEIRVTESYLSIDQDTRGCQNKESFFNCTTKKYIETVLTECKCLPVNLRLKDKVLFFKGYTNKLFRIVRKVYLGSSMFPQET